MLPVLQLQLPCKCLNVVCLFAFLTVTDLELYVLLTPSSQLAWLVTVLQTPSCTVLFCHLILRLLL